MSSPCKLCLGATAPQFSKTVLGRHRADYVECSKCGCLQVLSASWLSEAYASESWAIDTGLIARNLQLAGRIGTAASNLKCNTPFRVRCTDADQNDLPPASA